MLHESRDQSGIYRLDMQLLSRKLTETNDMLSAQNSNPFCTRVHRNNTPAWTVSITSSPSMSPKLPTAPSPNTITPHPPKQSLTLQARRARFATDEALS
eukprot:4553079-Amphidinium_carterae.1